jgi:hypothetical protein
VNLNSFLGDEMRTIHLVRLIVVCSLAGSNYALAQERQAETKVQKEVAALHDGILDQSAAAAQTPQAPDGIKGIIERIFKRENQEQEIIASYTPVIETYIQVEKSDPLMGTVPKNDFYFLGLADFRGKDMKVHSMTERTPKGSLMWSFEPSGFLQMVFPDWGGFNEDNYKLSYVKREFLGEVRCYVFSVERMSKAKGTRFVGRIWVEDQDLTIVRMNGSYAPEIKFSVKHYEDEFYVHFDSWRTNCKPNEWLPSDIFSQEMSESIPTGAPRFKARAHLWGNGVLTRKQQEELGRILVEGGTGVKDETNQHDQSPLDQQRAWRREGEINVMELLESAGIAAHPGDVDKVLETIVNNLIVTNGLESQLSNLHCRVLLTSNLELFSVHNTIVLSRGLIDVVPNEETMATLLAFELADVMVPKPAQDQYGFSDIMRLKPTQVLTNVSFVDKPDEATRNSETALELLKKSPYAGKLANAGLFLAQLQSQQKALKSLISARLGNQVFFTSQLLQLAPVLSPANLQQNGALPMGSRIKVNPWNDNVTLMKTQQMAPISPREKIPFEVTPINLYLTRYVESAEGEHTIVPRSQFPVVDVRATN